MPLTIAARKIVQGEFSLNIPAIQLTPGIYHLRGANGSGKTTFLRFLLGLLEGPNALGSGDVVPARRGYVPQNYREALLPWIRVAHNLEVFDQSKSLAMDLAHKFGLPAAEFRKWPFQLSGGQCQRVVAAREIGLLADLLALDEPFSALDKDSAGRVLSAISDHQSPAQITIFTSHIPVEEIHSGTSFQTLDARRIGESAAELCAI
jgi:ABC-type multidrug transport system ATPase subunit